MVTHGEAAAQLLHDGRQRVVGREQARPHRVAAALGDDLGVQERVRGRLGDPGDVGVPAVGVGWAVGGVLDGRRERGAAEHPGERVLPDGAEGRRERELLVLAQVLVVEEQHRVLVQRVAQQTRGRVVERVAQVDRVDDRTDRHAWWA